ncbi:MAG: ATP-binding cassette domain-containing protein [Gammaproteobacteria bacterium]|nr:ATP-binding cassette domain-containing protein [Gammaproteobacteria bacterium]
MDVYPVEVELAGVGLRLHGHVVLRAIDWRIRAGERWVLMGANGAGKTLLLKLVAGDVWPTPGRGRRVYHRRTERHDEPLGIKEEIAYVGAERQDRYEHYGWNARAAAVVGTGLTRSDLPQGPLSTRQRATVRALLRRLGIETLAGRRFLSLSYGQRRLVLLARALAMRPGLLLLDELLNGLDGGNRERVLRLLRRSARAARPWVLATHRLADIPSVATHLGLLERGRLRWTGTLAAARRRGLLAPASPAAHRAVRPGGRRGAEPAALITVRNGWVWLDGRVVLRRLDFVVRRGDCWVVHGPNGSGKSTLLRALYGELGVASQGELRRRGILPGVPIAEFQRRVGLVAPELQANHPLYLTALEVVASGPQASIGLDASPAAAARRAARAALRRFGCAALAARPLRALSYGQLRRVLFARAWAGRPDILLLDEPYTGLDARTRAALMQAVQRSLAAGATLVLTTHHREEWPAAVTHELELDAGRVVYCGGVRRRRRAG